MSSFVRFGGCLWTAFRQFRAHLGPQMAGAVAYFALLSVIPVLSLAVSAFGWVIGQDEALRRVEQAVLRYVPSGGEVIHDTLSLVRRDRGIVGLVGLIGLLVSSGAVFGSIGIAFNQIWGATTAPQVWWRPRLLALAGALTAMVLLAVSIALTSALAWVAHADVAGLRFVTTFGVYLGYAIALGVSTVMFAVLYRMLPNAVVSWRAAFAGGVAAGVAWELAKHAFSFYLARFGNYDKLYGSLGSAIILVVWTYYSAIVMLIGAELAATVDRWHRARRAGRVVSAE